MKKIFHWKTMGKNTTGFSNLGLGAPIRGSGSLAQQFQSIGLGFTKPRNIYFSPTVKCPPNRS